MATDDIKRTPADTSQDDAADRARSAVARDPAGAIRSDMPAGSPLDAQVKGSKDAAGDTPTTDEISEADPGFRIGLGGVSGAGDRDSGEGVKDATARDADIGDAVSGH